MQGPSTAALGAKSPFSRQHLVCLSVRTVTSLPRTLTNSAPPLLSHLPISPPWLSQGTAANMTQDWSLQNPLFLKAQLGPSQSHMKCLPLFFIFISPCFSG